jgi:hypothetical protein
MSARFLVVCCAVSVALIVPVTAGATASSNPRSGSAVDQYLQGVHTAGGTVHPGNNKNKTAAIDPKSAKALQLLSKSEQKVIKNEFANSGARRAAAGTPSSSSLVGSLLGAVSSPGAGSGNRLIVLLVAIVSITAALGFAAARKQRALRQIQH